jgi:hypothetical protein
MFRKPGEPPTSGHSKIATGEPAPDDGQIGEWPRKRLVEMDRKRRTRAFRRGAELRESAIGSPHRAGASRAGALPMEASRAGVVSRLADDNRARRRSISLHIDGQLARILSLKSIIL